jgi:methionyl aminopeptidase
MKPLRDAALGEFLDRLSAEFTTLPFAERWAYALNPKAPALLNQLLRTGTVMTYPALLDVGSGIVAQTEHTMIVRPGGADVTTA